MNNKNLKDIFLINLENISWKEIIELNGKDCSFILDRFKNLKWDEYETWWFENFLVKDGKLSEGAFFILPFLLYSLGFENGVNKKSVYVSLWEFANGHSLIDHNVEYKIASNGFEYFVKEEMNWDYKIPICIACRNFIAEHVNLFYSDLVSSDENYNKEILELICSFYEHPSLVISLLIKAHNNSPFAKKLIKKYLMSYVEDTDLYDIDYVKNKLI